MRISTSTIYASATRQMGSLQTALAKTQMQLATNRRMITPSDDPIASARALEVTQSKSVNTQYSVNRDNARSSLSLVEQSLNSVTLLLQDAKTIVVNAGNGSLTSVDRQSLAVELQGRMDDLLGQANASDGTGGYLFSGYKSDTLPFTKNATGAQYQGDQGQRQLQVSSARQVPISDSGSSVFENNNTGNGTFVATSVSTNTGSGIVSQGTVSDAQLLTGNNYEISFAVAPGTPPTTTYSILDTTTGLAPPGVAGPIAFESGQQIAFDGVVFDVKGSPADGDVITVEPSQKQSVFETLTNLLATLRAPVEGSSGQAALANGLNAANANLNFAHDNVLAVRSSVGSRLKELDHLDHAGADLNIQYETTLSNLQDLDLAAAISDFGRQQLTLEAAQKSFKAMSGLSLFNYI